MIAKAKQESAPRLTHREFALAMIPEVSDDLILLVEQVRITQQRVNYIMAALNTAEPNPPKEKP